MLIRLISRLAAMACFCIISIRCGDVSFRDLPSTSNQILEEESPQRTVCENGSELLPVPIKIIFIVDQSGSNVNGPYGFPGMATDPLKAARLRMIEDFFSLHQNKSHIEWALITFQGDSAAGRTRTIDDQTTFTASALDFQIALAEFRNSADAGRTPYRAAMRAASDLMIQDRMMNASASTQYKIVFITDGFPTDYCPGGAAEWDCQGRMLEDAIDEDLLQTLSVASNQVEWSSVYYGLVDQEAADRLARMSEIGKGTFVDANLNQDIQLEDFLKVDQEICRTL